MTKKMLIFCLLLIFPSTLLAVGSKILAFTGNVEARLTAADEDWVPAKRNMEILEGGTIRTGANGAAVIYMPNKTKIWLRANSNLEIEENKSFATRISLLFGSIKIRVPHLLRRERFRVKTPTAICAVRGTEFTLSSSEEGKMRIAVLYGEVKLEYTVPPSQGKNVVYIPQGHILSVAEKGKQGERALLTKAQESKALENWDPGLTPDERQKMFRQKENDRQQVKEFARVANDTDKKIRSFTDIVKESDIEAGRTLKDVHGNLVRVDQRLMRPDGQTLQFFNLVKRPVYTNKDHTGIGGFTYNGATSISNRLDLLQMNMVFNKTLPDRIEDWPGFMDNNSIFAEKAAFVSANKTDSSNVFFTAEYYLRDEARDELVNNSRVIGFSGTNDGDRDVLVAGVVGNSDFLKITNITANSIGMNVEDGGLSNGVLKYTDGSNPAISGINWSIKMPAPVVNDGTNYWENIDSSASLYHFESDAYKVGGVNSSGISIPIGESNPIFWYARESYVINNGGGIAKTEDFTDSGKDPFSILKEHAFEAVVYIKKNALSAAGNVNNLTFEDWTKSNIEDYISDYDFFTHNGENNNIDIVVIPDLGVAAVQRMLPILSKLSD
ncbi:MAG: FecR family protein [Elusimicrobia bacterium]|nr:FecR family protein [Elusimicrobiota bacterium]